MSDPTLVIVVPIAGIFGLILAGILTRYVLKKDTGSRAMAEIGEAIRVGAMAYLAR